MAIFTTGGTVGQISGRVGGIVYSHNRGGPYIRNGTIPTQGGEVYRPRARDFMRQASQLWATLTATQREAWTLWAQQNPIINRLGHSIHLQGNAAFVLCNNRLLWAYESTITAAPAANAPKELRTCTLTGDIGAGTVGITYTVTPIGATNHLWISACALDSAAITYWRHLLKFCGATPANQASPYDIQPLVEARLGALQVGQKLCIAVAVLDHATGLLSRPLWRTVIITST